ncbi:LamG domain-containing protein [bacterium]|nr:LamG domain-containing protein [bacterium]
MRKSFVFLGSLVLALCGLAQADLNDGLVAYYPFNGNANDESGNGINGIVNGATLAEDRFGKTNNAYSFDGNDFVSMGNPPSLRLSEDFTISSWALFSSNSGTDRILSFNQESGYELGIWDGNPWFAYGLTNHRSSQVIQPNTWFNLTVTKAGNLISLYLNGVKILEESNTNNPTFSRELRFGEKSQQDSWWTGKIDDTRFYDRALTNGEIASLYALEFQEFPDLNDGLIAYYPFNGNANDESGNGNNGTVSGATSTINRFGQADSAYNFEGVSTFIDIADPSTTRGLDNYSASFWLNTSYDIQTNERSSIFNTPSFRLLIQNRPGPSVAGYGKRLYLFSHDDRAGNTIEPWSSEYFFDVPLEQEWLHVGIVMDSANGPSLYLNGVEYLPAETNRDRPSGEFNYSRIGGGFSGALDNLRIYNRALTNEEITSLSTLENDPQWQLVINEQFDDADLENFDITRQNISINNGFLKTSARGTLVSKEEILGPKRIKMRVRPDSSVETFSLFIATNGESGGFAELLGLQATWTTDYSALQWLDRAAAQPELARLNMGFPAGQWLDIEILDYLTSASVIINGEARLDVDLSNYERVGNKIGLHSRELGGGSTIDYITVETLTSAPVTPAAPVVQLGDLYESPSGEAIVIDATPTAGFPAEYTYQWCFNSLKVPAALGGTSSSFSIDSLQANEGTWSVTVTNETGSVEQSFEYRIYADSDSDGLSDAYEELISMSDINNPDTDADGLRDAEEVNDYQTNPNSPDTDSDGFTDAYELQTAYDPNSADSTPDAQVGIMTAIEVNFNAALGATYEIQFSTDTIEWAVIETGIVGEGNAVERLYSKKDFPTGFFRVERTDQ